MRAKKSFGQHFLINDSLARAIVDRAIIEAGDLNILELGPGKAALTKHLIFAQSKFRMVEADREMIAYLKSNYSIPDQQIIEEDFLKIEFAAVFEDRPFLLLGNFPYNISSQILIKVIKHVQYVPILIGMFQLELADRIVSPPGKKSYGTLSVFTQAYYNARIIFRVSPGSFSPPPKVRSAVILLKRKNLTIPCNEHLFKVVVRASFNQRRKMMRNSLSGIIKNKELLKNDQLKNRPEQLSVKDFIELTNWIEKNNLDEFKREN